MRRLSSFGLILLLLVVAIIFPFRVNAYIEGLATTALILLILTLSWNITGGFAGQLSFGHAAFFGLGAYSCAQAMQNAKFPLVLAILLGGGVAAVSSVAIIPCFRTRGTYFAILTLAMAEALQLIAGHIFPGGTSGLFIQPVFSTTSHTAYFVALAVVVTAIMVAYLLARSDFGLALRALKSDPDAAESVGVNTLLDRYIAFVISAAFAGMAGAIYALVETFVDPGTVFDVNYSILPVLMAILGGMGTVTGPIIGSLLWSGLNEGIRRMSTDGSYSVMIYGVVLLLLAIFLPRGIVGQAAVLLRMQRVRGALSRRIRMSN